MACPIYFAACNLCTGKYAGCHLNGCRCDSVWISDDPLALIYHLMILQVNLAEYEIHGIEATQEQLISNTFLTNNKAHTSVDKYRYIGL